jgi:hypothetical protein
MFLVVVAMLAAFMGLIVTLGARIIAVSGVFTVNVPGAYATSFGIVWLILGVMLIAAAFGLGFLQPWAWIYTWMVVGMALVFALTNFILWGASLEFMMLAVGISAVILVYLSRCDVQLAFGRSVVQSDV